MLKWFSIQRVLVNCDNSLSACIIAVCVCSFVRDFFFHYSLAFFGIWFLICMEIIRASVQKNSNKSQTLWAKECLSPSSSPPPKYQWWTRRNTNIRNEKKNTFFSDCIRKHSIAMTHTAIKLQFTNNKKKTHAHTTKLSMCFVNMDTKRFDHEQREVRVYLPTRNTKRNEKKN